VIEAMVTGGLRPTKTINKEHELSCTPRRVDLLAANSFVRTLAKDSPFASILVRISVPLFMGIDRLDFPYKKHREHLRI